MYSLGGRKTRLDRDFGGHRFGSEGYAVEELVAELGAAFLCADLELAWNRAKIILLYRNLAESAGC